MDVTSQQQIAVEIVENNPAVAMRITGPIGAWKVVFITRNISFLGFEKEELLSGEIAWQDIVHPDDLEFLYKEVQEKEAQKIDSYTIYYRARKKNGESIWIADSTTVKRDEQGNPISYDCVITDHSLMSKAQLKIEDSLHRQNLVNEILQHLHVNEFDDSIQTIFKKVGKYLGIDRILLLEDEQDGSGCFLSYEWSEKKLARLLAKGPFCLQYAADIPELAPNKAIDDGLVLPYGIKSATTSKKFQRAAITSSVVFPVYTIEGRYGILSFEKSQGTTIWEPDIVQFLGNISKLVTTAVVRKQSAEAVEKIAYYDPLTGLTNRRRFDYHLQRAIASARKTGKMGYVLFVDMDDFKILNDGFGHNYGDAMLVEVANFFNTRFKDVARIFRFGGDEFLFLIESSPAGGMQSIIDAILERGNRSWNVLDKTFYCTLSVGVVRFPDGNAGVKEIVRHADIALHQAKSQGKNSYAVYRQSADYEMVARAEMEHQLRDAVRNRCAGFEVYYQPLVTADGLIVGAEALLRWHMPNGSIMLPGKFIPLAEYLGLIMPLGEYVLRAAAVACEKINRTHPDFYISVNASVRQFQQGNFPAKVKSIIKSAGVKFSNIVIEVTEGQAATDMQQMEHMISELRTMGIRVAMDDFGTGYSSLSNMRELPLDIIKIDRSFIQGVTSDAYAKSFIRLITELGHSMGRMVCVEGVETREQLLYCCECNSDIIQGFYFWHPMPLPNLEELLQ